MNTNQRLDRLEVMMEDVHGKLDTVIEIVRPMATRVQRLEGDVAELKDDMKTVKAAVTATNKDIKNHEKRITNLEHLNGVA